jgi:hypothetical protein
MLAPAHFIAYFMREFSRRHIILIHLVMVIHGSLHLGLFGGVRAFLD